MSNTAALSSIASTSYTTIVRDGYASTGDVPPLTYIASAAACSIAGGDGGSQVPSADGRCWLWNPPSGGVTPTEFGAKGDGSANDTSALQNAVNAASAAGVPLLFDVNHLYKITAAINITSPTAIEGPYRLGM